MGKVNWTDPESKAIEAAQEEMKNQWLTGIDQHCKERLGAEYAMRNVCIIQPGTDISEVPEEMLEYIAKKYPNAVYTAELLERAERERAAEVKEEMTCGK